MITLYFHWFVILQKGKHLLVLAPQIFESDALICSILLYIEYSFLELINNLNM